MSVMTTSGTSRAMPVMASSTERNAPEHRKPGVPLMSTASPSRTSRSSSMTATRSGFSDTKADYSQASPEVTYATT
jgi:hypothetical protein